MPRHPCLAAVAALVSLLPPARGADQPPRKAPDYTINLTGGKTLALSQYKGKVVIMAFILTYCSHCQRTVGFLTKDQAEYGPRGLQVVASAIEETAQLALPNFLKNFNPNFPVGYSTGLSAIAFMQHPVAKIPIMPLLAFIDRQGMIRAQYEGDDNNFFGDRHEQNLRDQIEALLRPAAAAKGAPKKATASKKKENR